jgi:hypothetical protein
VCTKTVAFSSRLRRDSGIWIFFIRQPADSKNKEEEWIMEQMNNHQKNKGGRPKKDVLKEQRIPLKCTSYEKAIIKAKAKKCGLTTSEYLLQFGLSGKIDSRVKNLPKELLDLKGTLNHMAANLNQLAKKRNSVTDVLTPLDRANLQVLSNHVKELAATIKNYLK